MSGKKRSLPQTSFCKTLKTCDPLCRKCEAAENMCVCPSTSKRTETAQILLELNPNNLKQLANCSDDASDEILELAKGEMNRLSEDIQLLDPVIIVDNSSASLEVPTPLKFRTKRFQERWLSDPLFQDWMEKDPSSPCHFICRPCGGKRLQAGKEEAKKHMLSYRHVTQVKRSIQKATTTMEINPNGSNQKAKELYMAQFIVNHNLAISVADDLNSLCNYIGDSTTKNATTLGRTKASCIIKNVLGEERKRHLFQTLRQNPLSIICDESTAIDFTKQLAIVARYVDDSMDVHDDFLTLIEFAEGKAQDLYRAIVDFFNNNSIDYKNNMVGYGSDGASVMFGVNNSLFTLLKRDIPHLFAMKCVCHSYHLCASHACKELPDMLENFLKNVATYFCTSKRLQKLHAFQDLFNLNQDKILRKSKSNYTTEVHFNEIYYELYSSFMYKN